MSVEELVKRLRAWADDSRMWGSVDQDLKHAAYKLEELAAENERLRRELSATTAERKRAQEACQQISENTEAALAKKDKEIASLREALFVADEAIMRSHGRFPLDRTTPDEVFLNDAAKLIRSYTDEDHSKRHLVVDVWAARNAGGNNGE